jgi:hypothetical protein
MSSPRPYHDLPGLEHIYLEDSYVLRVHWAESSLTFWLEAVLTEGHPDYTPPKPGEQYCYRRCRLSFFQPDDVRWEALDTLAAVDAAGGLDLGNIDSFQELGGQYYLEGGWGNVIVTGGRLVVEDWPEHVPDAVFSCR